MLLKDEHFSLGDQIEILKECVSDSNSLKDFD